MPRGVKGAGKAAPATPGTPGGAGDGPPAPTSQEAMLFFNMIKNLKTKPDIDWTGVAKDSGFKNAETAKASLYPSPASQSYHVPCGQACFGDILTNPPPPLEQVRFGQIKRKLGLDLNLGGASTRTPPSGSKGTPSGITKARPSSSKKAKQPEPSPEPEEEVLSDGEGLAAAAAAASGKPARVKREPDATPVKKAKKEADHDDDDPYYDDPYTAGAVKSETKLMPTTLSQHPSFGIPPPTFEAGSSNTSGLAFRHPALATYELPPAAAAAANDDSPSSTRANHSMSAIKSDPVEDEDEASLKNAPMWYQGGDNELPYIGGPNWEGYEEFGP